MFDDIAVRDWVYMTSECVVGVLSVVGNALVLLAIHRTRALQTVTNCFIGSLAAADLLVGIVIPPSTILSFRGLPAHFQSCVFLNSLVVLITNISILNLAAVALERFVAIRYPLHYHSLLTVRRAMLVVVATWVLAILLGLVPNMGWNKGASNFTVCSFLNVIGLEYMVYLVFFGVNIPPLIFMFVIYLYIYHIIRKQQRRSISQVMVLPAAQRRAVKQQMKDVRGARSLAYVIILFAVCWLPLHVLNTIALFAPAHNPPAWVLLATIVLSHANSFVNPFFYAYGNSRFKRAMKRLALCREADTTRDSDSPSFDTKSRNRSFAVTNGVVNGHLSPVNSHNRRDDSGPATGGDTGHSRERQPEIFVIGSDAFDLRPSTQTLDRPLSDDLSCEASLGRVNRAFSDSDSQVTNRPRSHTKSVSWRDENDSFLRPPASAANRKDGTSDTNNSHSFSLSEARVRFQNDVSADRTPEQELPIAVPLAESFHAHQTVLQTSRGSAHSTPSPLKQQRRVFLATARGHLDKVEPLYREDSHDRDTLVHDITSGSGEDSSLSRVYEVMLSLTDARSDHHTNTERNPTASETHGDGQTEVTYLSNRKQNALPEGSARSNSSSPSELFDTHGAKINLNTAQTLKSVSPPSVNTLPGDGDKTRVNSTMSDNTEIDGIFSSECFISVRL